MIIGSAKLVKNEQRNAEDIQEAKYYFDVLVVFCVYYTFV